MSDEATMKAWRVHEWGAPAPSVLKLEQIEIPQPEAGELLVRNDAIPLNLNDMERISGGNMMVRPELPLTPGMEVMGRVHACGPGTEAWAGKRVVAMSKGALGRLRRVLDLPDGLGPSRSRTTSRCPTPRRSTSRSTWPGSACSTAPISSAARPCSCKRAPAARARPPSSWQRDAGARVFATAGSPEKVALCEQLGAEVAIDYTKEDFADIVMERTSDRGVDVVFDNVGEAVMERSMHCLSYNGRYVMMGFASDKSCADEKFIVPRRVIAGNFHISVYCSPTRRRPSRP